MPTVQFRGEEIECEEGAVLRDVLQDAGLTPHNGKAKTFNCKGFANCGTCAVRVDGEVSDVGVREKVRLLVPPHHPNYRLRLACQTRVEGDVTVEKYPGMWGTDLASEPLPPVADDEADETEADESATTEPSAADTDADGTPQNAD